MKAVNDAIADKIIDARLATMRGAPPSDATEKEKSMHLLSD